MKIKEFVEQMKEGNAVASDLVSVKKYITFEDKIRMANQIIDFSSDYDRGVVMFDGLKKQLAFVFAVIEAHTDLRFADDWDERVHEYDILCENDLLDVIIGEFEKDYNASIDVLDVMCANILAENSVEASIAKLAQSISENLDVFVGALADKLEDLDIEKIIPKDLDLNKLQRLLNKIK